MERVLGGRFEIGKELGHGSGGIVYLASDREKGRQVALKVIPTSRFSRLSNSPHAIEDFQNEFNLLSRLHNPSLAEVYDFSFDPKEKSWFLSEEYFDGEPLTVHSGKIDFQRLAMLTARLCHALQFLHQQGIYHGDLKPSNILVKGDKVKVVDFGLARRFDLFRPEGRGRSGRKEEQGSIGGTLPYMAPELLLGAPVDGRSDLYSLGATLYELVSGHPPFTGGTIEALVEQHLFEAPVNPVSEGPAGNDIPKEFGFLILRLLNKEPSDRFAEANDIIRALNLQFHFSYPLGPEKSVLSAEQEKELQGQHVNRLYEQAIRFYEGEEGGEGEKDPESSRILAEIYYRQGNWDEAEQKLEGLSDPKAQLLRLQVALKKGKFASVRRDGEQLMSDAILKDQPEDQKGLLYNLLGTSLYYLGEYAASEDSFQKAFACYDKIKDRASRASLLNNLANIRIHEGKWHQAIALYEESVTLCRERGDVINEGLFLMSLGYAFHLKSKYEKALSYYKTSEALLEAIGYRAGVSKVKSNLANLFITTGALEKGEERLRQSEEIAREKGDRFLIAYSRLLTGDLLRKKGRAGEALDAYREGKGLFEELKSAHEEEIADRNISEIEAEMEGEVTSEASSLRPQKEKSPAPVSLPFLKRILAINRRVSLMQDVDQILEVIVDSMIEFTGAERGHLILREGGKDVVKVTRNFSKDSEGLGKDPADGGFSSSLVERVLKTGEPTITLDAMTDERFSLSLSIHKLKLRSVICIPFRVREAVIGAIYLDNRLQRGAFTDEMVDLLQAFADQAAIAITNAWVFDEIKKGAGEIKRLNEDLKKNLEVKEKELNQTQELLTRSRHETPLKYRYEKIVGRSPKMMEVLALIDRVTDSDIPAFLFGASGTGKELVARAIHENGKRGSGPFVAVNCSAIPETLMESELFGSMKGAFTGADQDRSGLFEQANGGTLLLDEIEDMPLAMQAKLLRVLQDKEVRRIGAKGSVKVDVRILSASNRDLKDLVEEKKFREDLFFRVHGIRIPLPSLRERKEDLPILIDHFLEKFAQEYGVKKKSVAPEAFDLLSRYSWPGNIRELENTISNACLLAGGEEIGMKDFRQKEELFTSLKRVVPRAGEERSLRDAMREVEREIIRMTMVESEWNITRASERLKVARPMLSRRVREHGLRPEGK